MTSSILLPENVTNPEAKFLYKAVLQGDYETVCNLLTPKEFPADIRRHKIAVVRLVTDARAIINVRFFYRKIFLLSGECTALHDAIAKMDVKIVNILLEFGADPQRPFEGYFLLTNRDIKAISCRPIDFITYLGERLVFTQQEDNVKKILEIAKLLIKYGEDLRGNVFSFAKLVKMSSVIMRHKPEFKQNILEIFQLLVRVRQM